MIFSPTKGVNNKAELFYTFSRYLTPLLFVAKNKNKLSLLTVNLLTDKDETLWLIYC